MGYEYLEGVKQTLRLVISPEFTSTLVNEMLQGLFSSHEVNWLTTAHIHVA